MRRLMLVVVILLLIAGYASGQNEIRLEAFGVTRFAEWSPTDNLLAVSGQSGVMIYDENFEEVILLEPPDFSMGGKLAWSPDGQWLAMTSDSLLMNPRINIQVYIWNTSTWELTHQLSMNDKEVIFRLHWDDSSERLFFLVYQRISDMERQLIRLTLYNIITDEIATYDLEEEQINRSSWQWSEDYQQVIALVQNEDREYSEQITIAIEGDEFGDLRRSEVDDDTLPVTNEHCSQVEIEDIEIDGERWHPSELICPPEGDVILGRRWDALRVYDAESGEYLYDFVQGDDGESIWEVTLNKEGSRLLLSNARFELFMYDWPSGDIIKERVMSIGGGWQSLNIDGTQIAIRTAAMSNVDRTTTYIYAVETGEELGRFIADDEYSNNFTTVSWSPDGRYIATGGQINDDLGIGRDLHPVDLFIWDAETYEILQIIPAQTYIWGGVRWIDWSADSRYVAWDTASNYYMGTQIGVWDVINEDMVLDSSAVDNWQVMSSDRFSLSPDGKTLALQGESIDDYNLYGIWFVDVESGEFLSNEPVPFYFAEWHSSGKYIAVRGRHYEDKFIHILEWQEDNTFVEIFNFEIVSDYAPSTILWNPKNDILALDYYRNDEDSNYVVGVELWEVIPEQQSATLLDVYEMDYTYVFSEWGRIFPYVRMSWSGDGTRLSVNVSHDLTVILVVEP